MRRVVITGMGIVSSIGNSAQEVTASLRESKSGITFADDHAEHGFRSQVHGKPQIDLTEAVDKRQLRFMGDGAAYNFIAMQQAIADAGLEDTDVSNERTGLIMGSGGPSTKNLFNAHQITIEKGSPKRMGPFMVTRCMSSTNSACLATPFRIKGVNYSITSACSTSAHCIGNGVEQIQWGKQDIVFAGGGEELDWTLSCLFDAMGAMSFQVQRQPGHGVARVRRDPRRVRDRRRRRGRGAGGTGARQGARRQDLCRGDRLRRDVRRPRHGGPVWRGRRAVDAPGDGDAGRPQGGLHQRPWHLDARGRRGRGRGGPADAIPDGVPPISSTKSLTGHSLGATGVQEAIYCLLMLEGDFIAASANIEELDPALKPAEIATSRVDNAGLDTVLSNSFGFGGTNATLALSRYHG